MELVSRLASSGPVRIQKQCTSPYGRLQQHRGMTKMSLAEFTSGAMFAAALVGSGVYEPSIIKGQMDFSSNTMITVFLGASATSA
jgi:hypothetical protein